MNITETRTATLESGMAATRALLKKHAKDEPRAKALRATLERAEALAVSVRNSERTFGDAALSVDEASKRATASRLAHEAASKAFDDHAMGIEPIDGALLVKQRDALFVAEAVMRHAYENLTRARARSSETEDRATSVWMSWRNRNAQIIAKTRAIWHSMLKGESKNGEGIARQHAAELRTPVDVGLALVAEVEALAEFDVERAEYITARARSQGTKPKDAENGVVTRAEIERLFALRFDLTTLPKDHPAQFATA